MRKKKAIVNIFFSFLLQIVTIISGFIIPRLFICKYGSNVNGLINSITSFIGYITLLQAGVGSVVKASLYKPLANKNKKELSIIVKTARLFFYKISLATILYLGALSIVFSKFFSESYGWIYTSSLVVIIGISTAAQYFFGITYQMILEADQRAYVYSTIQIFTIIINTILVIFTINLGCSVQIVKLVSSLVFIARPIIVSIYTKHYYKIDSKVEKDNSLIKQRWDGFVQAIALFIHQKTDIFVLTLFASFLDVSVYSVYMLVTTGLTSLIDSIDKSVRSAFGNIIACKEKKTLIHAFDSYNTLIHIFSTVCFSTAAVTIFDFISVYVKNISDANYIRPVFGILILTSEFIYCLRMPYNSIIYAAGRFKETKISAAIEAIINIIISCVLVLFLGLPGVAIGTLIAMVYRTISFMMYLHKNVLEFSKKRQLKRYILSVSNYLFIMIVLSVVNINVNNYIEWGLYATVIFLISTAITLFYNAIFDYKTLKNSIIMLLKRNKGKTDI